MSQQIAVWVMMAANRMMRVAFIELLVIVAIVPAAMIVTRALIAGWGKMFHLRNRQQVLLMMNTAIAALFVAVGFGIMIMIIVVVIVIGARYLSVFASSLDPLVAVLVETGEIRPEAAIVLGHNLRVCYVCEADCQIS
jgi:hypothetical protein